MSNSETNFWKQIKKNLEDEFFLTRIETLTVSGVPDVFGIYKGNSFWIELKSNPVNFPNLNKYQIVWINRAINNGGVVIILVKAFLQKRLKIYRIRKNFTDPRSLIADFTTPIPVNWTLVKDNLKTLLLT